MSKQVVSKLKTARAKLGLTQREMAEKLEIPLGTLIKWENDRSTPHVLTWEAVRWKLAALLARN